MNETSEDRDDIVKQILTDAATYIDSVVTLDREKATNYYFARPFGNESVGRSKVVMSDVRDAVEQTIPSLMRVFTGPERYVEFEPKDAEQVAMAEQATDYINTVVMTGSDGFSVILDAMKDGLVRKLGIVKWAWDDTSADENYRIENVPQEGVEMLMQDESITVNGVEQSAAGPIVDPSQPPAPLFTVTLTRHQPNGTARIWSVPPEEFLYNRNARSKADARVMAHRTRKTRGELIEMGVSAEDIDEYGDESSDLNDNSLVLARDPLALLSHRSPEEQGRANEGVLYVEAFMRVDHDGDDVAELRRICTIGPLYHIVSDEPANDVPFAFWCPIPEPHTMTGQSLADLTMDLQLLNSALMRGMLDSLSAAIFPRTWAKEGDANIQDVMNTELGSVIRTRSGANAVGTFAHPFVGKEALAILGYVSEIKEGRVGRAGGANGLHMDSMQSSTKGAVAAAVSDANMRTEMFARIFAEQLMKPLFRGLLKLYVEHKPKPKMVKMGGAWETIDPAAWDAEMNVTVNVALGAGLVEDKIAMYEAIVAKQEQLMQMLGPQNPLVDLVGYRAAIDAVVKLRGRKDVDRFFLPFGAKEKAEMEKRLAEAPQEPKEDTPEQTIAKATLEVEKMKTQRELTVKEATLKFEEAKETARHERELQKMELDHQLAMAKLQMEDDRLRDIASADIALRENEIAAKYGVALTTAQIDQETEMHRTHAMAEAASQAGSETA